MIPRRAFRGLPLLALLLLAIRPEAAQANALRCGGQLVIEGDRTVEVLKKCGEPQHVTRRRGLGAAYDRRYGRTYRYPLGPVEIEIEEWTYDFGPQRFMHRLVFEHGVLTKIETLDRGD